MFSTLNFLKCSQMCSVLSQCNTRPRLLHLLYDMEVRWRKTIKHAFSVFYVLIKHGFLTNQSTILHYFGLYYKLWRKLCRMISAENVPYFVTRTDHWHWSVFVSMASTFVPVDLDKLLDDFEENEEGEAVCSNCYCSTVQKQWHFVCTVHG